MTDTITWVDPDGATVTLHGGSDMFVVWNVSGRFSPPTRFETDDIPDGDGARLRAVHHGVREFLLPVWVQAATESALRTAIRTLISAMNPVRGDGRIQVTSSLGDQREIVCRVSAGLEGQERIGDSSGVWAQMFPLMFRAHEPYWRDISDTVYGPIVVDAEPGTFFSDQFFPMQLADSEVFASVTVTNSGDVEAWPVWTITGPGESPLLRNLTTGKDLLLADYTIAAGEVVTIDTRPDGPTRKTVVSSTVGSLFGRLSGTTSLWPLAPGANAVTIEMAAATDASAVSIARRHRYLAV